MGITVIALNIVQIDASQICLWLFVFWIWIKSHLPDLSYHLPFFRTIVVEVFRFKLSKNYQDIVQVRVSALSSAGLRLCCIFSCTLHSSTFSLIPCCCKMIITLHIWLGPSFCSASKGNACWSCLCPAMIGVNWALFQLFEINQN